MERVMTHFRAEPVTRHQPLTRTTVCLNCSRAFTADTRVVTFYAENEVVGFVCSACVSADARELLASKKA